MKIRSIQNQLNYVISQNVRIGESKRGFQQNPNTKNVKGQVFSVQYAENLRATADQFGKWMRTAHPEIRLARDIENQHVQEWLEVKAPQWSEKTLENKISQLGVIFQQLENTFNRKNDFEVEKPVNTKAQKVRDVKMEKEDLELLRQEFKDSGSMGAVALEVSYRCGLRIKEISRLHSTCINIDKQVIFVTEGAKNGKYREVPIRSQDLAYFADLKAQIGDGYICKGVREDSLNRSIRRAMERVGISEKYPMSTNHAIRKLYATERWQEELAKSLDERKAWEKVQIELGHGEGFRQALFNTYIKP